MILLVFLSTFCYIQANGQQHAAVNPSIQQRPQVLQIYGDVHKDQTFFEEVLPWLIDNFGGYIALQYSLLGSGVYTVPQMCALSQLGSNVFLQAEYLKCEAAGTNPPEYCLCLIDIEPKAYRTCVYTKGWLARDAYNRLLYNKHMTDETPIVDSSKWSMTGSNTAADYFDKICQLFGENKPHTCDQALPENMFRGAVRFDCNKVDPTGLSLSMNFTSINENKIKLKKLKSLTFKKEEKKSKEDHENKQDKKEDKKEERQETKQDKNENENETKLHSSKKGTKRRYSLHNYWNE